jgi:hypothetical protein
VSLSIAPDDFAYGALFNRGGAIAAAKAFASASPALLDELNAEVVA